MIGIGIGSGSGGGGSGSVSPIGASLDLIFRDPLGVEFGAPRTIAGTTTVAGWPNLGTFTRASTADWINVAGNGLETQAANNVLRRGPVRGALFEQGVTAQPMNSLAWAGGVAGVVGSGGQWPSQIGPGASAGLTYTLSFFTEANQAIMRVAVSGTRSSVGDPRLLFASFVAANLQNWVHEGSLRLVANTGPSPGVALGLGFTDFPATTEFNPAASAFSAPSSLTRVGIGSTAANASIARVRPTVVFDNSGASGRDVNMTFDVALNMAYEASSTGFRTSPILTTNSGAVTRAADQLVVPVSLAGDFTAVFIGRLGTGAVARMFSASDGSNNNVREVFSSSPNLLVNQIVAGVSTGAIASIAAPSVGARFAYAARFTPTATAASLNGGALSTAVLSSAPSGINTLFIGNRFGGDRSWSDYIERVIVFPTAVNDATLQSYSTLATWGA